MADERNITLSFTDGSELAFTFPKQLGNPHLRAKRIQAELDWPKLAFEIDNELLGCAYQQHQVPASESLPGNTARDGNHWGCHQGLNVAVAC